MPFRKKSAPSVSPATTQSGSSSTETPGPSSAIAACLHKTLDGLATACLPTATLGALLDSTTLQVPEQSPRPDALQLQARYDLNPVPADVAQAALVAQKLSLPQDQNR